MYGVYVGSVWGSYGVHMGSAGCVGSGGSAGCAAGMSLQVNGVCGLGPAGTVTPWAKMGGRNGAAAICEQP